MSLKQFGRLRLSCEEVADCKRRVLFLRDPLERLRSAYQYFKKGQSIGGSYKPFDLSAMTTYEAFVDMTFELEDRHWGPQVADCRSYTEVRPWETLGAFILAETGAPLQWVNASPPLEVDSTYRLDELMERYWEDYALLSQFPGLPSTAGLSIINPPPWRLDHAETSH